MEYKVIFGVPCHNSANWIDLLLYTFSIQSNKDFECWFALDDCTDNTEDIILSYRNMLDIRIFKCNYHTPSSTRQLILDNAPSGSFIFWCDSDDCVIDNASRIIHETADSMLKRGETWTLFKSEFVDFKTLEKIATPHEMPIDFSPYVAGNLYSVDKLREANIRFDENLKYSEDIIFNECVLEYDINNDDNHDIWMSDAVIYLHRENPNSMTHNEYEMNECNINVWRYKVWTKHLTGKPKYSIYYQMYTRCVLEDCRLMIELYTATKRPKKQLHTYLCTLLKSLKYGRYELINRLEMGVFRGGSMKDYKVMHELISLIERVKKN